MSSDMMTERPNTVSGLLAKRDELLKLRKHLEADLHKVTCDLDHLEATIALFDGSQTPAAVQRYVTKHRAKKGHLRRFVLGFLRDASEPVTSKQITEAWIAARGLNADEPTYVILRKRIGACLTSLKIDGLAAQAGMIGEYKGWQRVQ